VSRAMVLLHLKAILTLVCLKKLVIFRICGEVNVKVAHFVLFPAFVPGVTCIILCSTWCFSLWGRVFGNLLFFCNVEDGLPLIVKSVIIEGKLNILSM